MVPTHIGRIFVWHLEQRGSEQALDTNNDDDEANIYTIYTIYLQLKMLIKDKTSVQFLSRL
jgi:hypothetical protein